MTLVLVLGWFVDVVHMNFTYESCVPGHRGRSGIIGKFRQIIVVGVHWMDQRLFGLFDAALEW
jgi:hypothetical protein